MFDHVTIRVADRSVSERFYDTVLAALAVEQTYRTSAFSEWRDFLVAAAEGADRTTRGLHIGFAAPSRKHVEGFWQAGTAAGYADDGGPGPRPEYRPDYYSAFLLDPDGNSVEAVHHGALRRDGIVDHLWIRVGSLVAARGFYETIAPSAHLRIGTDTPERVSFSGGNGSPIGAGGSFSLVPGTPTANVHIAVPTSDDADVRSFHQDAVDGGYRDNGAPGERPRYHPGYYTAYVLDPDGNNIEVVNHHRT
jgi:catechol 2,3-dioxygenase-like lactoylglutathione lyase family enzyme